MKRLLQVEEEDLMSVYTIPIDSERFLIMIEACTIGIVVLIPMK